MYTSPTSVWPGQGVVEMGNFEVPVITSVRPCICPWGTTAAEQATQLTRSLNACLRVMTKIYPLVVPKL